MPIVTCQTVVLNLLVNLPIPGPDGATLNTFVTPLNPQDDVLQPTALIWPGRGGEHRESVPRPYQGTPQTGSTEAGWKQHEPRVSVFLTWDQDPDDPAQDVSFPLIVDAVMDALRCATDPVKVQDQVTYRWSQVSGVGEKMDYEIAYPRYLAPQRLRRYDAEITVMMTESFQA
jgi:hypothetical protein